MDSALTPSQNAAESLERGGSAERVVAKTQHLTKGHPVVFAANKAIKYQFGERKK